MALKAARPRCGAGHSTLKAAKTRSEKKMENVNVNEVGKEETSKVSQEPQNGGVGGGA
jgi:hypothetical protein